MEPYNDSPLRLINGNNTKVIIRNKNITPGTVLDNCDICCTNNTNNISQGKYSTKKGATLNGQYISIYWVLIMKNIKDKNFKNNG